MPAEDVMEAPRDAGAPLVFISHDSRDAELADAFSKLLRRVSAGKIEGLEPDEDVVRDQVIIFKKTAALAKVISSKTDQKKREEESTTAKALEEIKIMFRELSTRMVEGPDRAGESEQR